MRSLISNTTLNRLLGGIAILISLFALYSPAQAQTESTEVKTSEARIDLNVPFGETKKVGTLNEYLLQAYQFAGILIISIAILAILIAGVMWLTSGGNAPRITQARAIILSAITGVVLFILSYIILSLINPDLVNLRPIQGLNVFDRIDFESIAGIELGRIPSAPNLVRIRGGNIIVAASDPRITSELLPDVQAAAQALDDQGFNFIVSSAFRDPAKQQSLVEQNCTGVSCENFTCTVTGSCSPPTCKLSNGAESCPHTTGRAIDVWGGKNGAQCIRLAECAANKEACAQNECQKAIIQEMRKQGFCRLCAEPWHFEKPKMSACCN